MDKGRLAAFSDGVFSIAMTLLIFDIHVPVLDKPVTDAALWLALADIWPHIVIFIVSFIVMAVLWINHHFIFHTFAKSVDRGLNLLNLLYLMAVAFVPFSSSLIGEYWREQPAGIVYGLNIFLIVLLSAAMMSYIRHHPDLQHEISSRLTKQARLRSAISLLSYTAGIVCTFFFIPLAVFFYIFPVIFNIVPGSLNMLERVFKFTLE